ncbi:hypothetical protein WJU16_10545 [Chitinophaga pollutisoli]|uniref:Uncharacterized protein n=1 Tax=Chitinophaga pollutisoli TaxID=3133966 RepID=A0ABZ2YUV8_9BACT
METTIQTIAAIQKLDLRDQGIFQLKINFEDETIAVTLAVYDEKSDEDRLYPFVFDQTADLQLDMDLRAFYNMQIETCEVILLDDGRYWLKMVVYQGHGLRTGHLNFTFADCAQDEN